MRLPDRLGRFEGIQDLPLILTASNALVYVFELIYPGLTPLLTLVPPAALAGEYWRFLTFLFVPPPMSPLFMFFWLYLFYIYAQALENEWGTFRFTAYYVVAALATAAAGLYPAFGIVPNVYLNTSLFLAFAALFPDFELMIFFILPMKVKYLAWAVWVWLAYSFWQGDILNRLAITAAVAGYLLFFGRDMGERIALRIQVYFNRRR